MRVLFSSPLNPVCLSCVIIRPYPVNCLLLVKLCIPIFFTCLENCRPYLGPSDNWLHLYVCLLGSISTAKRSFVLATIKTEHYFQETVAIMEKLDN